MPHPDAKIIDLIIKEIARGNPHGAATRAAKALGADYHRLHNWRERGVPATMRLRVMTLANAYGATLPLSWLDVAKPTAPTKGKSDGRTRKGKQPGKEARAKGKRQPQSRRAVVRGAERRAV